MKAPYLVLLIFFISCSSSKNTASTMLYPNNGKNLLKNLGVPARSDMPHKSASAELYSVPLRVCQKIMCLVQ